MVPVLGEVQTLALGEVRALGGLESWLMGKLAITEVRWVEQIELRGQ
jgi:hypothetical protein